MAEQLLGNLDTGLMFVVSAPAGTGKTTLVRMLVKEFDCVVESVSYTTRKPRPGEIEGKDYHFISQEQFQSKIEKRDFLEYAEVFGHFYGTSKSDVENLLRLGKDVVIVIDTQGAMKLQQQKIPAIYIFVAPPSVEELEERLLKRKTEDEKTLKERLSWANREIEASSAYDYLIVNRNLDIAYEVLKSILVAEEHRVKK
jgi:guanylate kinase